MADVKRLPRQVAVGTVTAVRGGWRRLRRTTHARGAGATGLASLIELHGVHSAGDALFTVALANTVFFSLDPSAAKGHVALYLVLTMAPFAVVAPVIGPLLDRLGHGRRIVIAVTLLGRAWLAYLVSNAILDSGSLTLYPAALGVLVLSKAYTVSRSAAVPRMLPRDMTLVSANARLTMSGLVTAAIAAPLGAGIGHLFGAQWPPRLAIFVYLAAAVLAMRLPKRVDSSAGEQRLGERPEGPWWRVVFPRLRQPATVVTALRAQVALRALAGFLTLYLAFLIRTHHLGGLGEKEALALLVIGAAVGGLLGTAVGTRLPKRSPEWLLFALLAASTVASIAAAVLFGIWSALTMALLGNFAQSLGKLALDAVIQRDVPESVRTSSFARTETFNQLGWVAGGGLGVALPLGGTIGFAIAATWLLVTLVFLVRDLRRRRTASPLGRTAAATSQAGAGAGRPVA